MCELKSPVHAMKNAEIRMYGVAVPGGVLELPSEWIFGWDVFWLERTDEGVAAAIKVDPEAEVRPWQYVFRKSQEPWGQLEGFHFVQSIRLDDEIYELFIEEDGAR